MFDNIGEKIKSLAKVLCWIGIGLSFILGCLFLAEEQVIFGFLFMIIGALISWVSSFCLYGFGELICYARRIEKNTKNLRPKKSKVEIYDENKDKIKRFLKNNSISAYKKLELECPDCGEEHAYSNEYLYFEDEPKCINCSSYLVEKDDEDDSK